MTSKPNYKVGDKIKFTQKWVDGGGKLKRTIIPNAEIIEIENESIIRDLYVKLVLPNFKKFFEFNRGVYVKYITNTDSTYSYTWILQGEIINDED